MYINDIITAISDIIETHEQVLRRIAFWELVKSLQLPMIF